MTVVFGVTLVMLGISALLVLTRLVIGPSPLDRILALDVLSVLLVAGVLLDGAHRQQVEYPLAVTIALLGFVATITAARFLGTDQREEPGEPADLEESGGGE